MKRSLIIAAAVVLSASGPVFAQIQPVKPIPRPVPTPRFTPKVLPTLKTCRVDPAIASVTLTKGTRARQVQIAYRVVNRGSTAWVSGANQQNVNLTAHNANTNSYYRNTQRLTGNAAAGATMLSWTSPFIDNAFDDFEFAGDLTVQIGYDPDILLDSNTCNDDVNSANNRVTIDNGAILGFLKGTARSKTFTF